jgi:hypothetical protein
MPDQSNPDEALASRRPWSTCCWSACAAGAPKRAC